jgi:hypothetical protein
VPYANALFDFLFEESPLLGCVEELSGVPNEILGWHPGHADEAGIHEDDALAIIGDEHTFIHRLQDLLHLQNPIGPLKVVKHPGIPFCAASAEIGILSD